MPSASSLVNAGGDGLIAGLEGPLVWLLQAVPQADSAARQEITLKTWRSPGARLGPCDHRSLARRNAGDQRGEPAGLERSLRTRWTTSGH
jgi:hypothetical protein